MTENQTCEPCHATCSSCTKGTALHCKDCAPGYVYHVRACVSSCPSGTWFDNVKNRCVDCPLYCEACASTTSCTTCAAGFLQHGPGGLCSAPSRCNTAQGYFVSNNLYCLRCPDNCASCSGKTCQSCFEGYKLRFGGCWDPENDAKYGYIVVVLVALLGIAAAGGCYLYHRSRKVIEKPVIPSLEATGAINLPRSRVGDTKPDQTGPEIRSENRELKSNADQTLNNSELDRTV